MNKLFFLLFFASFSIAHASDCNTEPNVKTCEAEARQGNVNSQYLLAAIYRNGVGVTPNDELALKWYEKSANGGHAAAQFSMGLIYERGLFGIKENSTKAQAWFKSSAELGHAEAYKYLNGNQAKQKVLSADEKQHLDKLLKAAANNNANAQFQLANILAKGTYLPKDLASAFKLYVSAAQLGHVYAHAKLSTMYALGKGTKKDYVQAYAFASIAASKGNELGVAVRDKVVTKMTPQDILTSKELAKAWIKKHH